MPRRVIGQEILGFDAAERVSSLDTLHELIDWAPLESVLGEIYAAERGEAHAPFLEGALIDDLLANRSDRSERHVGHQETFQPGIAVVS